VRHVAAFLVFWITLWWTWQLLAGEWSAYQWVAGAIAATVAAALGEIARARAGVQPTRGIGVVACAYSVVPMIVIDFALVLWALPARRRGQFRPAEAANPWIALLATYSPNAYVVSEDTLHRLVPFDKSEEPG
jgi:hypothetical protein